MELVQHTGIGVTFTPVAPPKFNTGTLFIRDEEVTCPLCKGKCFEKIELFSEVCYDCVDCKARIFSSNSRVRVNTDGS